MVTPMTNIMQMECAEIVITELVETKLLRIALTLKGNFMQRESARIVILASIIKRKDLRKEEESIRSHLDKIHYKQLRPQRIWKLER